MINRLLLDTDPAIISEGSYKGNAMLVLAEDTRFPFQFGAGKARLLLRAMEHMGAENFAAMLKEFCAEKKDGG